MTFDITASKNFSTEILLVKSRKIRKVVVMEKGNHERSAIGIGTNFFLKRFFEIASLLELKKIYAII